ncbi:HD-GYP domain-containing protein [Aeromonas diversa]|uniref:HD-GYP domain-containing protein n=1 Tax=Aeromonas diversa CDC 2478-85 TaxID=1268237 RepID=N9V8X6_9GAMM|nr:HD-GYP domain-containing protein [Aeromonas diversa]ENY71692.1 HD-GYP domain-containing protein [Aeromonas diversa CDC 2478-85]
MAGIKISVDRLQVGNYVSLPLGWREHPFLFSSFLIKEPEQIELIRRLGLKQVVIMPDKSEAPPKPLQESQSAPPCDASVLEAQQKAMQEEKERRIAQLQKYRRELQQCEKHFQQSLAQVRGVMNKIQSRPLNAIADAHELVGAMTKQLMSVDEMVLHLVSGGEDENNLYFHSLNVCVLSMLLAKECGMEANEINLVGLGALFHDIGKLKIPSHILRKTEPLTQPEINLMAQHPRYGLDLLSLAKDFPDAAKGIVLRHHERLDGSGYPEGLKGDQIDPLSQLVGLVNEYDDLCHHRGKVPYSALSGLYKQKAVQYNEHYLTRMVRLLGLYPPGSVVQLSDGRVGLVMSINASRLLYPSVLIYDAAVPRHEAAIIDLEHVGLSIAKVISPRRLPPAIFEYLNPRTRISYYFEHSSN